MREAFEEDQYKLVKEVGTFAGGTPILVGIWQYKEGPKKVKIQRIGKKKEGAYYRDVGGMSLEELSQVLPLLKEAEKWLKEN